MVVTSALTLAMYAIVFIFKYKKELWKTTYLNVPYFLVHSIAAVCCYHGWLPPRLKIPNKNIFDFQILVNFIIINALPLIEIRFTVFAMVPILLITTYMQVTVQAKDLAEIFSYLPAEIKIKHRLPSELVTSTMVRTFLIGAIFISAHYL